MPAPVYYELAELALAEGDDPPGVWSGGAFFPLDAPHEARRPLARRARRAGRRSRCSPATFPRLRADADIPAAVLVAITDRPEPGVILTVRREHAHPCRPDRLPGGRIDPGEDAIARGAARGA